MYDTHIELRYQRAAIVSTSKSVSEDACKACVRTTKAPVVSLLKTLNPDYSVLVGSRKG